jgi:hypothetical protein
MAALINNSPDSVSRHAAFATSEGAGKIEGGKAP